VDSKKHILLKEMKSHHEFKKSISKKLSEISPLCWKIRIRSVEWFYTQRASNCYDEEHLTAFTKSENLFFREKWFHIKKKTVVWSYKINHIIAKSENDDMMI
jgi:hypothetical protein